MAFRSFDGVHLLVLPTLALEHVSASSSSCSISALPWPISCVPTIDAIGDIAIDVAVEGTGSGMFFFP